MTQSPSSPTRESDSGRFRLAAMAMSDSDATPVSPGERGEEHELPESLALEPAAFAGLPPEGQQAAFHTLREAYLALWREYGVIQWSFNDLQRHLSRFARFARLIGELNYDSLESLSRFAVEEIPALVGARYGLLYLYDPDARTLHPHRATVPPVASRPLSLAADTNELAVRLAWADGPPDPITDLEAYCAIQSPPLKYPEDGACLGTYILGCPLKLHTAGQTELMGVLLLGDRNEPFQPDEVECATLFADVLAAFLLNARLLERLEGLAHTDPLTRLANRRQLDREMTRQIAYARRYGQSFAALMMDIDHFKRVNDTHGHPVGDAVLRHLAGLLTSAVHDRLDTVARYGGEEFVVLLPNTGAEGAMAAAERLRANVEAAPFALPGGPLPFTISVGIASWTPGETAESLLARADAALYQAKNDGRNRVRLAAAANG